MKKKKFLWTLSKIADLSCLYNISSEINFFIKRYLSFYTITCLPGKFILTVCLNAI